MEEYQARTKASAALAHRARAAIPGGTSHALRWYDPYPVFIRRASGPYVWDVDGNRYLDFWMGHWALILGHSPPVVAEAIGRQLEQGTLWGHVSELEVRFAEKVKELVPCAERVRLTNTGSEATMYAVRLARAFTGGSRILKLHGGWHGFNTDLLGADPRRPPTGLPPELKTLVGTIPYNDLQSSLAKIETTQDLAAVIVEPFLGGPYFLPPSRDYLKGLREACDEKGTVLIFDETVTGFRLALGGAQEVYGVKPDLATFAKVIGGGMPGACIAGREDIMELSNVGKWKGKGVAIGGGTFSANPMTLAAGLATLEHLASNPEVYQRLDGLGAKMRRGVEEALGDAGIPVACTGAGSLFETHFLKSSGVRLRTASDVDSSTDMAMADGPFRRELMVKGFYTMHGGGAISTSHEPEQLEGFMAAVQDVGRGLGGRGR